MSSEEVSFTLQLTVDQAVTELRKFQTFLYRSIALAKRLGLPEDLDEMATKIQRITMLFNQARLAAIAFQAASGPLGWALAGVGMATTALTYVETMEYVTRG